MYPILSSLMIDSGFALNSMVKEECAAAAVGAEMQHQQQQQLLTECKIEQSALENDFDQDDAAELATVENALSDLDETFLASVVGQHGSFEFVEAADAADAYRSESIDYMMNMEDQFDATQPSLENSSELTLNLLDEALCIDLLASLDQQCWHTSNNNNNNNETDQAILAVLIAEVEANGDDESIQAEVSADLAPLLHDMSESALSSPSDAAACQSPMYESRRNSDSDNSISTTTMMTTIASGRSAKKRKAVQDDDDGDGDGDELSDARSSNNKKEANKAAALRYRNKKQREKDEMFAECEDYERRNASLKQQIDDVQSEIDCIKSLLVQVLVSKNNNNNSNTSPALTSV
jgi:hypothetical protein